MTMLFKNLKSGNIISVSDASTAELMRRAEMYEEIIPAPVSASNKEKAEIRKRKPKTKK